MQTNRLRMKKFLMQIGKKFIFFKLWHNVHPWFLAYYLKFYFATKLAQKPSGFNIYTGTGSLRNSNDFADVTLACAEGHQVEAHKVILGAASPFFQQFTKKKQSY